MKKTIGIIILIVLSLTTACGKATNSYQTINLDKAKQMIEENPEVIVLDVRTLEEFNEGHIPNALLYPVQEIETRLTELDKEKTYIVVCRSGNRSRTASNILAENGFKHIYNTSGGMSQWTGPVE